MPFRFPTASEFAYRIWRLRRLIALAVFLPFFFFVVLGFLGLNGVAGSTGGAIVIALLLTAIIGGHAVVFPNANEETIALSLVMVGVSLILAVLPWSFFGVLLCAILAIWALMWGQCKITEWPSQTKDHQPVLKSRIKVRADFIKARDWFAYRPDHEFGHYRCGPVGADGVFPVWMDMPAVDMLANMFVPGASGDEDAFEGSAIEHDDPDYDELNEMSEAPLYDDEEDHPSFWARIETNQPDYQKTLIFEEADGCAVETVVEHKFKTVGGRCLVTEIEKPSAYPWGLTLGMWLNDFQKDGLLHRRDLLEKTETKTLRASHRWSLLMLTGKWFMARQIDKANAAES